MFTLLLLFACSDADNTDKVGQGPEHTGHSGQQETAACDTGVLGYADLDGDGYGDADVPVTGCDDVASVVEGGDCDDTDAAVSPSATEVCDGVDNDCDGEADDGLTTSWWTDADGDGHGDPASETVSCSAPEGAVNTSDDCDDSEPLAWDGATEVCGDGVDNDCDGEGCSLTGLLDVEDAFAVHTGVSSGDYAGLGVAFPGDWDGDGSDDMLIGASLEDANGLDSGAVYVVTATVSGPLSDGMAWAEGAHADASHGQSVAAVGDMTGDGRVDLLACAPAVVVSAEFKPGVAYLYDGATGTDLDLHTTYEGVGNYEGLGYAALGLDDIDEDGAPEILLGATTHGYLEGTWTGAVYLVREAPGGTVDVTDAGYQLLGGDRSMAGAALAEAGDVDGDGRSDVLIGSGGLGEVAAWLVTEGWGDGQLDDIATTRIAPEATGAGTGSAVAGAGDVDGDGHADLLIGAYADGTYGVYAGAAWLLTGVPTGDVALDDADAKILGEAASSFTGLGLGGVWDQDGDGGDDIIVTARQDSEGGYNAGAVFILPGSTRGTVGTSSYLTKIIGSESVLVGQRVGNAGDQDGDGLDDLWISGTGYDGKRGAVYLFSLVSL